MSLGRNRIFLKSVARNFKRTGAVAPSSRSLGNAMICELVRNYRSPVRVLEVGGGTGNITEVIAGALRPEDHLDVFEIDEELSRVLRRRLAEDVCFAHVRSSVHVHNSPIEEIDRTSRYDYIISCLPFTCFQPAAVRQIFEVYRGILNPGGVCSFFEYILIRKAARFVSGSALERTRVAGVGRIVEEYVKRYSYRRDLVFRNLPPAMVQHIRFTPD